MKLKAVQQTSEHTLQSLRLDTQSMSYHLNASQTTMLNHAPIPLDLNDNESLSKRRLHPEILDKGGALGT